VSSKQRTGTLARRTGTLGLWNRHPRRAGQAPSGCGTGTLAGQDGHLRGMERAPSRDGMRWNCVPEVVEPDAAGVAWAE
jgi:hypothetical protein